MSLAEEYLPFELKSNENFTSMRGNSLKENYLLDSCDLCHTNQFKRKYLLRGSCIVLVYFSNKIRSIEKL